MEVNIQPSTPHGTIQTPPSKSMAHRLMICAALAQGTSTISNMTDSQDMQATRRCIQTLGAAIEQTKTNQIKITGTNPAKRTQTTFDCGESGSTLRFMIPLAALSDKEAVFTGQGRLMERPMDIYANLFAQQGLTYNQGNGKIIIKGPIQGGLYEIPGNISSQFITGLLFAGTQLDQMELAVLPPYQSKSYVGLTLQALKQFQADIDQPTSHGYILTKQTLKAANCTVEGDYSQAAFFIVLGVLTGTITITGLDPNSQQGDKAIIDIVQQAGGTLHWHNDQLQTQKSSLHATTIDLADCPDLGPILCVLAAFCQGTTTIQNAARLRLKESDRIQAMETELKKAGVNITSTQNTITITGKKHYHQADFDSHNDHRIAMALAVFAIAANQETTIQQAQAINKSYPTFYNDLKQLGIEVTTCSTSQS